MDYNERTSNILRIIKERRQVNVEELAKTLYVSTATVRRDLNELQKAGQIKRVHGGAIYVDEADEISIFIRQAKNAREKEHAATIALGCLPEFTTVFLDNSSTCLALAERLNLSFKTVITNGLQVAMHVSRHDNVNIIIPGGEIKYNTTAVLGSMAANNLRNFSFDLSITSCSAINAEGTYEYTLESMQIKQLAMSRSRKRALIFDNTKIDTVTAFCTGSLESYDYLITDATDEQLKSLKSLHPYLKFYNK